MSRRTRDRVLDAASSLKLTLACLALLMLLIGLCTVRQVDLGTYGAVETYMRSAFVYARPEGFPWRLPVLPGGGLVGAALLVNLLAAQWKRPLRDRRKAGLWLAHLGLILLFAGEFVTAWRSVETQLPIEEGRTRDYAESPRVHELAVIDPSEPGSDLVFSVPEPALATRSRIEHPRLPFSILVKRYYANAALEPFAPGSAGPATVLRSLADRGPGAGLKATPLAPDLAEERGNNPAAFVELMAGDRSLGSWLVSPELDAQGLRYIGRDWRIALRPQRRYLPFSLTLKDFKHDIYPGTDIPRNFSSLVRLKDPAAGEDRDVLIYMNHPLRHRGFTFYQASFGKSDTLSVLQVMENPGWLLPYAALALTTLGLLLHFGTRFGLAAA